MHQKKPKQTQKNDKKKDDVVPFSQPERFAARNEKAAKPYRPKPMCYDYSFTKTVYFM